MSPRWTAFLSFAVLACGVSGYRVERRQYQVADQCQSPPSAQIDEVASKVLSCFQGGGRDIAVIPNATHSDLRAGEGSMPQLILTTLGLNDVKWQMAVEQSTRTYPNVKAFVDKVVCNIKQNPILLKVATRAPKVAKFPVLDDEGCYEIRYSVVYAFVLNSLTEALFNEPKGGPLWKALLPGLSAVREAANWFEGCPTACKSISVFEEMKIKSIDDVLLRYESVKLGNTSVEEDWANKGGEDLFMNIVEAVFADLLVKHEDNAWAGYELAMEPYNRQPIPGAGNEFHKDHLGLGVWDQKSPFPREWTDLYLSWNLAFCTNYPHFPLIFAKLLPPVVTMYVEPEKEGLFLWPRIVALALHIQMAVMSRVISNSTATPLLKLAADGTVVADRPFGEWRNNNLAVVWGSVNLEAAKTYQQKVHAAISKGRIGPFPRFQALQRYTLRRAKGRVLWSKIKKKAVVSESASATPSVNPDEMMEELQRAYAMLFDGDAH